MKKSAFSLLTLGFAAEGAMAKQQQVQRVKGLEPGVSLQLTEGFFQEWKKVLAEEYVTYVNLHEGKGFPTDYYSPYFSLRDIKYSKLEMDYEHFDIKFLPKHDRVKIYFPLIKRMDAEFNLKLDILSLYTLNTPVKAHIRDVKMKGTFGEDVLRWGIPQYIIPNFSFTIGHSSVKMEGKPVLQWFTNELLRIFNVVASTATEWFGESLVDLAVEHGVEQFTDFYQYPFEWDHQGMIEYFTFDLRQTQDPEVGRDFVNLHFLGDMNSQFQRKQFGLPPRGQGYEFDKKKNAAQILITDHSLTSFFHALDQGGMLQMDSGMDSFKKIIQIPLDDILTTSDIADYFPEFENHYGRKQMEIQLYTKGDTRVETRMHPDEDESFLTAEFPVYMAFNVAIGDNLDFTQLAFDGVFNIQTEIDLRTQNNKLFVKFSDIYCPSISLDHDNIEVAMEIDTFQGEFNRFFEDYNDLFNQVLFENGQHLPIPDYFRVQFEYLNGAMIAELNFAGQN